MSGNVLSLESQLKRASQLPRQNIPLHLPSTLDAMIQLLLQQQERISDLESRLDRLNRKVRDE